MVDPKIVSFYTPDYKPYAEALQASAKTFGLTVHAGLLGSFDSWHAVVMYKPRFILQMLESLERFDESQGVLWVDADACFRAKPDFQILTECDFAATQFRWSLGHPWEMLTGTLFFRNTPRVKDFIQMWSSLTEQNWKHHDTPEQMGLKEAWELNKKEQLPLRYLDLPVTWTWILPEFDNLYSGVPFIVHLQASRTMRK